MKPPDFLLPSNRRNAIHFMVSKLGDSPLFGQTEMVGAACGVAVKDWANKLTTQKHLVTCRACWHVANPKPSMFESRKA